MIKTQYDKMKKIFYILVVACLPFFWACETERDNPFALTPDSFVLNTPKYVSGIYDLKNTESIQFTTSQPNYGFTAATTYRMQVATQKEFKDFVVLPTPFTSAKMDVSATEIAVALVGLLGIEDEANFPTDPFPVFVRLSAELSNGSHKVLSNIVELPKVKSYFALDPMVMPENMYLIGNVAGNWSWDKATEMIPVWGTEGKFWALQYLGKSGDENALIKFNMTKAWDGTEFGFNGVTIDPASISLANITANDEGNIVIGKPGWYIVVVTTTINGRSYEYAVDFYEPNVYLSGDAIGGVWGAGTNNIFTVPDISLGANAEFVSPVFTGASTDGLRASIVLPGHEWWHTEFMVFDGKLEYRGKGGDQEPRVAGVAGQKLYINFTQKTGKIE